jgi:hypothetical protein
MYGVKCGEYYSKCNDTYKDMKHMECIL